MSVDTTTLKEQPELVREVIDKGLCVRCGGCVGLCPYFQYYDGKVVVSDGCEASPSRCVQVCPRLPYDRSELYEARYGTKEPGRPLGPYLEIVCARSTKKEIQARAQYGGVITSLTILAMEKEIIRHVVLTDRGEDLFPRGILCNDPGEILGCAGSRYSGAASLEQLNVAIKAGKEALGFVGLPCQMEALSRMALSEPDGRERAAHVSLRLGLFCTWALDYRALRSYLMAKGVNILPRKYDIPPPPSEVFVVDLGERIMEFPLSEIRELVQPGCMHCRDMTAEFADISVGTLEGDESWNTVIIRTQEGLDLFNLAVAEGLIEQKEMPQGNLNHLIEAATNKKKRALRAEQEGKHEQNK